MPNSSSIRFGAYPILHAESHAGFLPGTGGCAPVPRTPSRFWGGGPLPVRGGSSLQSGQSALPTPAPMRHGPSRGGGGVRRAMGCRNAAGAGGGQLSVSAPQASSGQKRSCSGWSTGWATAAGKRGLPARWTWSNLNSPLRSARPSWPKPPVSGFRSLHSVSD